MKKFEEMKVAELKQECRNRGLKLEHKGHKFTKAELVEQLNNYEDARRADEVVKAVENTVEQKQEEEVKETKKAVVEAEVKPAETKIIKFAHTLEEIETKYTHRKKQSVYDNELQVGSFVVFVHYVEAKDGNIYKKLRTAKVVAVNRKRELVRVKTLLGTEKELTFDEVLYIRKNQKGCTYPDDIDKFLRGQRTEKGKALINERFAEPEAVRN